MANLIASDYSSLYWLWLLIYSPVVLGGLLIVAIVGGLVYSSIKSRRR
jgi:hypothetical protein